MINMKNDRPDQVKAAYRIADNLRAAGFIVSTQVDNENRDEFKWILDVNDKTPEVIVFDQAGKHKQTVQTIGELLKLLGGKGGS
jgi:2-keto-4-pentenoate hydratase